MGSDGKIYAELATLCDRNETARARELADKETQDAPSVLVALLQHAVIAEDVRVLQVLLGCASRATCNLNAAISKDGKTVLHVAVAKRNLLVVRYLLDAGANLKAKDKKACPLQNAVFKLEQRNEALEQHTDKLIDTTRRTSYATENVELESAEVQAHFQASVQYEESLKDQIEVAKARIDEAEDSIRNQGPRLAHIDQEIKTTKSTIAGLVQQVDKTVGNTVACRKESERLRSRHADQLRQLSVVEKQSAVKCEAVEILQRFDSDEMLQEKFVRSLSVLCQRVAVAKKLAMGGVQERLVDILVSFGGGNPSIFRHGVASITQLIAMKAKHREDLVLCNYLKPWPASSLIPTLAHSLLSLAVKMEQNLASLLRVFTEFVGRLQDDPIQSDLSREDFVAVVSTAAQAIANHPVISGITDLDIKESVDKLATSMQKAQTLLHSNT